MDVDGDRLWDTGARVADAAPHGAATTEIREPAEHILISGTGRAGTSFLVRYLTALGLDTHLSRSDNPSWFEDANAGLEDIPEAGAEPGSQPYVLKSPWAMQEIDRVLADPLIRLRAMLVPVRDIAEATASRVILQLQAMHRDNHRFAGNPETWRSFGSTPGGLIYSLEPLDQARLLALDFYMLVQRTVQADVPVVLLDFPRMTRDWQYLHQKLLPVLPNPVGEAAARRAHGAVADASKVRVGSELRAGRDDVQPASSARSSVALPEFAQLDRIAVGRELASVRAKLAQALDDVARLEAAATEHEAEAARLESECSAALRTAHAAAFALEAAQAEAVRLAAAEAEMRADQAETEAAHAAAEAAHLQAQAEVNAANALLAATRASRSWRITAPLRAVHLGVSRLRRRKQGVG